MADRVCDQCGAEGVGPFRCAACGALLVPDPTRDHFHLLGVAPAPDLDLADLERRFLALCRDLHPDHAGGDAAARARAVLHTAQVNEAYAVLADRFRRLDYLLRLRGGPGADEEKGVPDGFLEEMMERRMALAEVSPAEAPAARAALRADLDAALAPLSTLLAPERDGEPPPDLKAARRLLNKASYLRGMLRDLNEEMQ